MKTKWDLNLILPKETITNPEKYRKLIEKNTNAFIKKWKDNLNYLTNPKLLKQALDEYSTWATNYGTYVEESYYYGLSSSLDLNDTKIRAANNIIHQKSVSLYNEIQFFTLNISKIKKELQSKFLNSKDLKEYSHFLEELFRSGKYTLSEAEERIMNLKGKVSKGNWVQMLSGLLAKEEKEVLGKDKKKSLKNFSEIMELISNPDKKIRDTAAKALNEIFLKHLDVAENELNSVLENKKINDEIRGYKRADESRHVEDDVDTKSVDILVKTVTNRFDISKRFYKLKARILKLNQLEYHERNLDVGEVVKEYKYKEAYDLVYKTFNKLDPEFSEIFKRFHENGQVDVYPKKGKRSGAFCAYYTKRTPIYVFLNHTDSLNNVLTLAHEFGHAFHFELSKAKQNELNNSFPMATAETASTFFEDFVLEEILKEASEKDQLSILTRKLDDDVSTIIRQIACYNFETDLHAEFRNVGYISKDRFGELFTKDMSAYMGPAVNQTTGSSNWWVYWSHIRSYFYVYSYAFGLLASKTLQKQVKNDPKNIEKVKLFLSSGSSKSPKDLFKDLGINVSSEKIWNDGLDEVEALLTRTERLAKKLGY